HRFLANLRRRGGDAHSAGYDTRFVNHFVAPVDDDGIVGAVDQIQVSQPRSNTWIANPATSSSIGSLLNVPDPARRIRATKYVQRAGSIDLWQRRRHAGRRALVSVGSPATGQPIRPLGH